MMKKITRIFSLVIVLAMAFTMTAFAADANEITVTTDVASVSTDGTVTVNLELSGDLKDVALVQYSIKYDTTKFTVNTATDRNTGYKCYDSAWYAPLKNYEGLGYIATPSCGENPAGTVNVIYLSTDGYYIDGESALYLDDTTTTAGKIKFTAITDVATIDSSCFEVINVAVTETSGTDHAVTVNQIASAEEDKTEAAIGSTGDVTFDYADDDAASSALSGKRVVLDTAGNKITGDVKDKKVAVTYTDGTTTETKTFGETLNELLGLDGDGSVTATVRFGIVCDPAMTGTFTFAIVD